MSPTIHVTYIAKQAHNITILSVDDPQEHSLMPPHETTVILHSHIIQDSSLKSTYTELIQRDIKQHALIIIFPYSIPQEMGFMHYASSITES